MASTQERPAAAAQARRTSIRKDIVPFSNGVLYLVFCLLAATGLALEFRLDEPTDQMLGLSKRDWARVHAITALSVLSLVAFHLWTNWPWIRTMLSRLRWRTVIVALVGLALLVTALLAPVS
jgi:cell division protein FtsW (lipid II flippase)